MPNYLHRTTKQFLTSTSPASLTEPEVNYIKDPDLSAIAGFPSRYWTITGDVVSLMSKAERDAVDAAALTARRDSTADQLDFIEEVLRAFALTVLDEINVLRSQHALPARTIAQLKTTVRGKLGT